MSSGTRTLSVPVADGAVPIHVAGPDRAPERAGLIVIPSIFGPAEELLGQIEELSDVAVTAVVDPFWRQEAGAIPYRDREAAFERVGGLDRKAAWTDVASVAAWVGQRTNGRVAGLGICFGGPFALVGAAEGLLAGAVTWHGSRMEQFLDRVVANGPGAVPLRLHFGGDDPVTPPEAIEAIADALAGHPDCEIVVHPGLDHGYSHAGDAWNAGATEAGLADLRRVLVSLGG